MEMLEGIVDRRLGIEAHNFRIDGRIHDSHGKALIVPWMSPETQAWEANPTRRWLAGVTGLVTLLCETVRGRSTMLDKELVMKLIKRDERIPAMDDISSHNPDH